MDESVNVTCPVRPLKGSAFILAISLAFAFSTVPPAARAAEAEAVTINTNFTVFTPPVRLDKPAPTARASVVLMVGGNGRLALEADGTLPGVSNFLIRSANLFLRNGLNVMMPDTAPAHPNGLTDGDRLSALHAAELQGFINAARNRWGKPVWVIGTSSSSISTVTAGGFRPGLTRLRGVVLTSSVTVLSAADQATLAADQATFNLYAARITVPALVVWHRNDHCSFSPPDGSAALFEVLPSIDKASLSFEHGHSVAQDPCQPFSEHGYAGIEKEVVDEIAEFILGTEQD
jgi:hypothetical protein